MIIHPQLGRILMEERLAKAEQARALLEYRRHRRDKRRSKTETPEADVIELTFGTHCGIDQIGA